MRKHNYVVGLETQCTFKVIEQNITLKDARRFVKNSDKYLGVKYSIFRLVEVKK